MLNCYDFRRFDESLQLEILREDGVFLMVRKTERTNVKLFSLYNFHVEVFFEKIYGEILYIKPFEEPRFLDVYLEVISIERALERMNKL